MSSQATESLRVIAEAAKALIDLIARQEQAQAAPAMDENLTIAEAADLLKVSPGLVRNAIHARQLHAERHGRLGYRIPSSELEAYRKRRLLK